MKATSIFATDLDGTLLRSDGSFASEDIQALEDLRRAGCAVILATGRSPFSLERCLAGRKLPVDWMVLSSGAGVVNAGGEVKLSRVLSPWQTEKAHRAFSAMGIEDISIQGPFPDAHQLHWIPGNHGEDFLTRLGLYRGYAVEVESPSMEASEVIGFAEPEQADMVIAGVEEALGDGFSVIRATSPINHRTVWIEVFQGGVNKGSACEHIRNELDADPEMTAAVGNDWNDLHMLEWADTSFMVEGSPEEIAGGYIRVPSVENGGVARAAELWLGRLS